jgi:regulator of replication initiation timing
MNLSEITGAIQVLHSMSNGRFTDNETPELVTKKLKHLLSLLPSANFLPESAGKEDGSTQVAEKTESSTIISFNEAERQHILNEIRANVNSMNYSDADKIANLHIDLGRARAEICKLKDNEKSYHGQVEFYKAETAKLQVENNNLRNALKEEKAKNNDLYAEKNHHRKDAEYWYCSYNDLLKLHKGSL